MAGSSSVGVLDAVVTPVDISAQPKPADAQAKLHHQKNGNGFQNPWASYYHQSRTTITMHFLWRLITRQAHVPNPTGPTVPVHRPNFLQTRETSNIRATWLGHASSYVEFPGGLRVLFDPVFEDRCSPSAWFGPKRFTDPPCAIRDLPFVDAVVISHSHYDHLSLPTIQQIHQNHPRAHFFAPLGNKKWFTSIGIENMTELDWWESCDLRLSPSKVQPSNEPSIQISKTPADSSGGEITARIGCLPCQHMAARSMFDNCKTLWASWSIEAGGKKLWFAGDTGYRSVTQVPKGESDYSEKYANLPRCPAFAQIAENRGPFDLGLIPIGAYAPRFTLSSVHASPEDSVNIFRDSGCKRALAVHWGTWVLSEEAVLEPPKLLKKALRKYDIEEDGVFDVCDIGESVEFPDSSESSSGPNPKL